MMGNTIEDHGARRHDEPMDQALPLHDNMALTELSVAELIDLLIADEDRAPRNLIDACASRGEEMIDALSAYLADDAMWRPDLSLGRWWMKLHAINILGLMDDPRAGVVIARAMERVARDKDENLEEWLSSCWPALFKRCGTPVEALERIVQDASINPYLRANAFDCLIADAASDAAVLDARLRFAATLAADRSCDTALRMLLGNLLLDFPRPEHRALLEALARQQNDQRVGMFVDFRSRT